MSRAREDYLVTYLENQAVAEIIKNESQIMAHFIPLPIKQRNMIKETFDTHKAFSEILLPSGKKQVKLENMSKTELKAISNQLKKLKAELIKPKK